MDEPAKKRQRIISEGEGPLKEGLESLARALEGLYHRVDLIQWKTELLHLDLSDIQSLQAHLVKFGKKLDKIDGPVPKHKCPQCPKKRFSRLDNLLAHCEANHPEREYLTLSCPCPCPRSFKHLRQRNEHLKSYHLEEYEMERFLIEEGAGRFKRARTIGVYSFFSFSIFNYLIIVSECRNCACNMKLWR